MRRACRPVIIVGVLLGAAAPALADFKDIFRKGLNAMNERNWPEVEANMRLAISEKPKEGEPIRVYGVRYEPYLPHYYLGVALLNRGDCAGALKAWAESERQGAVQKTGWHRMLLQDSESCRARLARDLTPATTLAPPGSLATTVPLTTLATAAPLSVPATPTTLVNPSLAPPSRAAGPSPERQAEKASPQISRPTRDPSPRGPTPTVLAGIQAFFDGRYEEAWRGLAAERPATPGARIQVALFRAASAFAYARTDPGVQSHALEDARSAARGLSAEAIEAARRAGVLSPALVREILAAAATTGSAQKR